MEHQMHYGHWNLGFEPGAFDSFDRFFAKNVIKKLWRQNDGIKRKKFKRHIVAYKISDCFMVI
jgi:hypothetical protein